MKNFICLLLLLTAAGFTSLYSQTRTITGKISSASELSGIPGVTVAVRGGTQAASTDNEGNFSISAPMGRVVLQISSIGYSTREITVEEGQNNINISLEAGSEQMSEVVVTALGITREAKTLTYATQTIKPRQLTEVRDPNNLLNSLSGKVANAVITQGSGGPGSGARIVMRGNRSIQGSNNALIVVDGVPIINNTYSTAGSDFGSVQGSDGASNINPDDIESVTVLRGASAAALYGSQAGNGVIVITTKKGSKDRISVSLNSGIALESPFALPELQNSYGQGNSGILDITKGDSWGPKMTGQTYTDHLGNQMNYSAQPDNIRDFFRNGISTNNSIGVSGGSEKMQTYLSYTFNQIEGIVPTNDLKRHTVNLRLTNQISNRFSTDAKITYISQDIENRPRTGEENAPVINIYQIPRSVSLSAAEQYETINNLGIPTPTPWPSTLTSIYQNPYWVIHRTSQNEVRDRLMGFVSAKFQITDWLNLRGRANLDRTFDRLESLYSQGTILWANQPGGYYGKSNIITTQKWFDLIMEGQNKISGDLSVHYHVGAIFQDSRNDVNNATANGLNVTNKFSLNYATNPAISSNSYQVQTQSVFGQVNLAFKEAIFLDASLRNDWDSRLPSPYTFSYPSVGISAVLSDLVQLPSAFSFLKLNANYAEVGNGGQAQIRTTSYGYSQGAGQGFLTRSSVLPIPGLKPEIVKNIEIGLEGRFFEDRFGFSLNWYKSNSFNQLLRIALPNATGFGSQYINAGNIQNTGVELVLNASPVSSSNFNWDLTLNFATNKNLVKELSEILKIVYLGGGFGRSATPVVKEGGSYGDLLAFRWKTNEKGNREVVSTGSTMGVPASSAEQEYIGNFNPKATIGLTNSFAYKRFSMRILVDGRVGGIAVSGTEMNLAFSGITKGTEEFRDGGWSLGGEDAAGQPVTQAITAQQFWQAASGKRYGLGEFFAYDATNFRIRELSLGYDFPFSGNSFIKNARLSLVARNVLWLYRGESKMDIPGVAKRKMWFDPDMSLGNSNFQGVEYGTLPATRTIGLNLGVTF